MTIHVNSSISDVKSIYMCMDVKYLYLINHMERDEQITIQLSMIPQEFCRNIISQKKHTLDASMQRVTKGMYGLPQAVLIAHYALVKQLERYGYHP